MVSLLSSTDVARSLGVSPASVKRLADDGLLACVRTRGGHRRFDAREIDRYRQVQVTLAGRVATWADRFLSVHGSAGVLAFIQEERSRAGTWWTVALQLGSVDAELARRVVTSEISAVDRLVAVERLERAVEQCSATMNVGPGAATAVLARPEFDHERLGLSLVELCSGELGWATLFVGAVTSRELRAHLEHLAPAAVVLTASRLSDPARVEPYVATVQADCLRLGIPLSFVGDAVGAHNRLDALRTWLLDLGARRLVIGEPL
jgi:excisionase family DNA binding protein